MNVFEAFPSRPIGIKRIGATRRTAWLAVLTGVVMAAGIAWWQGGDLWRDYRISRHYEMAADAGITSGRCKAYQAVFVYCAATIASADGRKAEVDMMFVDIHLGDYQTGVVRSLDDPSLMTLQLGVENLVDRVLTFLGLFGLFVLLVVGALVVALRAGALKRAVAAPSQLTPVSAEVLEQTRTLLNNAVKYRYFSGDRMRTATTLLRRDERPFFVDIGETRALAVIPANASTPILLDGQLEMLDLTSEERATLRDAVAAPRGPEIVPDPRDRW